MRSAEVPKADYWRSIFGIILLPVTIVQASQVGTGGTRVTFWTYDLTLTIRVQSLDFPQQDTQFRQLSAAVHHFLSHHRQQIFSLGIIRKNKP